MKHCLVLVLFALTLVLMSISSVGRGTTGTALGGYPAPTPSSAAVPGTELRGRVATVKPGYEFVRREIGVAVVRIRTNAYMGAYTCPCGSSDPNRKCDLVFSPTQITCKSGSCGGSNSCLLVGSTPTMRQ